MYSRQEASRIRQDFWTAFGRYMQPIRSSEGEEINWVNYKTGIKHIHFRMHAGKGASIGIEITHKDEQLRQQYFARFVQLKNIFRDVMKEEWLWMENAKDENDKPISCIYVEMKGVVIMNKGHWPQLISFFKPRIIALDEFWNLVKDGFEMI